MTKERGEEMEREEDGYKFVQNYTQSSDLHYFKTFNLSVFHHWKFLLLPLIPASCISGLFNVLWEGARGCQESGLSRRSSLPGNSLFSNTFLIFYEIFAIL